MDFGKNRVQYEEYPWFYYRYEKFDTYFYTGGKELAVYTAKTAQEHLLKIQEIFDYELQNNIQFIIYNKQSHFRQSNVGITSESESDIGGVTQIIGNKVFLYFEGDHGKLDQQIKAGLAQLLIHEMLYGGNWKEAVKNAALFKLPDWYTKGLIAYASEPWNTDAENLVKDGVLSGKFKKINLLNGDDALIYGYALWNYVASTYGNRVLSNIVYMTKVSRNVESGFLFVIGTSMASLNEEWQAFYTDKYFVKDQLRNMPQDSSKLKVKIKKSRVYSQLKLNADGSKVAYVTNELGQYKLFIYDVSSGKRKRIMKVGHKLQRINDYSYPLLNWHPNGQLLSIVIERQAKPILLFYSLETGEFMEKPIFQEKVLSYDYSDDGKQLVFSAVAKGQSDIFVYNIAANSHKQITNDVFDDLFPRFINNSQEIIFSSNRPSDTLNITDEKDIKIYSASKDLFTYNFNSKAPLLKRITNTPLVDETQSELYEGHRFSYLSNLNGVKNRFVASFDSVISHIDTAVHYRYFIRSTPQTNYTRNILEHHINPKSNKIAQILFNKGKYQMHLESINSGLIDSIPEFDFPVYFPEKMPLKIVVDEQKKNQDIIKSKPNEQEIKNERSNAQLNIDTLSNAQNNIEKSKSKKRPRFKTLTSSDSLDDSSSTNQENNLPESSVSENSANQIDINNYEFSDKPIAIDTVGKQSDPVSLSQDTFNKKDSVNQFVLPTQRNYNIVYFTDYVVSKLDNNFFSQSYQRFAGGKSPLYQNAGYNGILKLGVSDLFENRKIVGGMRISPTLTNNEYFLSYEDLTHRIDHQYIFHRMSQQIASGEDLTKVHTNEIKYIAKYAFSEVTALRGTVNFRHDNIVRLASDYRNLQVPNTSEYFINLKGEYVFDNTLPRDMNLYTGTRAKIFAEYYKNINMPNSYVTVLGFDLRNYLKIHRDFIWANRIAASSSLGPQRLIYYLGGVDSWIFPKYDASTGFNQNLNYVFQALATNMRGFYQNARNGTNFAVINSELRLPVFKFLYNKPIRSDFIRNFMLIGFSDVGSAWNGLNPYNDNNLSTKVIYSNPLFIKIKNQKSPIISSYGYGLRTTIWGYYLRADWAWGIDNGIILPRIFYLSVNLDF